MSRRAFGLRIAWDDSPPVFRKGNDKRAKRLAGLTSYEIFDTPRHRAFDLDHNLCLPRCVEEFPLASAKTKPLPENRILATHSCDAISVAPITPLGAAFHGRWNGRTIGTF